VIGKKNDPEVVGLLGHLPAKDCQVIGDTEAAQNVRIPLNQFLASITQTALSVKDTTQIVQVLRRRFPKLIEPRMDTIYYATTNRQQAVRPIATKTAASLVLGSATSSNFTRLTEVAGQVSCKKVRLVSEPDELCLAWLNGVNVLGLTASASAPEYLVQRLIDRLVRRRSIKVEKIPVTKRKIPFRIPLRRFPKLSQISISRSAIKPQKHQEDFYQNKSSFSNQELHLA
jgi:4-hydroxy-3-methylbut-2-enyl diphosphate reductase